MIDLIEVKKDVFVAVHSITRVTRSFYEKKEKPKMDMGLKIPGRTIGDACTIKIKTSAGEDYTLDEEYSAKAHDRLFGTGGVTE